MFRSLAIVSGSYGQDWTQIRPGNTGALIESRRVTVLSTLEIKHTAYLKAFGVSPNLQNQSSV